MAVSITKQDVREIVEKSVSKAVDDLSEIITTLAQSMHDEIRELKVENHEIRASIDRLTNTIDGFVARIDKYETEQAARDIQFDRLVEWAHKVSKKTGIPLENL